MIWIALALLTGLAVFSVLWPLSRPQKGVAAADSDVAFYRAQIAEIERDAGRGLIAEPDAKAARAEAGRRLLAAGEGVQAQASQTSIRLAAILALVLIPAIALSVYGRLGAPEFPDQPLEARLRAAPEQMDMAAAVARIEAHLKANPGDGRGWEIVAPVYLRMRRGEDAVNAWRNAIRFSGDTPARQSSLGEAIVVVSEGRVTAEALAAFEAAAKDESLPQPRFFIGLAAEQAGDAAKARDIWTKLLATAPPDASWVPMVRARFDKLAPAQGSAAGAIAALPPAEQQAAIRTMVGSLAERLAQNGNDAEGWLRLVRAWRVLQEPDKAKSALSEARRAMKDNAEATRRLDALARELGLEG